MNLNYQKFGFMDGMPYMLPIERKTTSATNGATAQATIQVPNDDFYVVEMNGKATDGDNLSVKIEITTEGIILMESACLFSSIIGTAQLPFVLPEPLKLPANATARFYFTNLNATAQTIDVTLVGKKVRAKK